MTRSLYLFDEIYTQSVEEVIRRIVSINSYDRTQEEEIDEPTKCPPIDLYINSPGGIVYDGFALIDVIQQSKTPIHTYALGSCMSMAIPIFAAGDKRFAYKNTTFLYHGISQELWGNALCIRNTAQELDRLQFRYDNILLQNTDIPAEQLEEWRDKNYDIIFDSDEALKYNICTDIL